MVRWQSYVSAVVGSLLIAAWAGCGKSEFIEVTGTVTYGGKPITDDGEIRFIPHDKSIASVAGKLNGGEFELRSKPGKMKVYIQAVRWTGRWDPVEKCEITELYIPARYNDKSELEIEVTRDGDNHFDFALTE
jgi:hypothetical protein